MEKTMKNERLPLIFIIVAFLFSACAPSAPTLSNEMIVAMTSYSEQRDMDIVSLCVNEPKGIYWHQDAHMWAVSCKVKEIKDTYGVVLMDEAYNILVVDYLNAKSISNLKELLFSSGWQER